MIILTILFILLDVISKLLISNYLEVYESINIIGDFLKFTYVHNTGAAWSLFNDKSFMVLIISVIIILIIGYYIYKNKPNNRIEKFGYALILGGAIGNFIDRVIYGYVIDFIDVKIFNYDYPIFNLADMFIVIGVILLIIKSWGNGRGNKSIRK